MTDLNPGSIFNQDPSMLGVGQLGRPTMGVAAGLEEPRFSGLNGAFPYSAGPYEGEQRSLMFNSDTRRGNMRKLETRVQQLTFVQENFYTQVLLPIEILPIWVEGVYWEDIIYNRALPHHRSDLGHTRTMTQKRTGGAAGLTQFALGVDMEKAFQMTPEGQQEYQNGIRQIVLMFVEHLKIRVLDAILNAHRLEGEYQKTLNYYRGDSIAASIEKRLQFWGISQREKNGLEKMDVVVSSYMDATEGKANVYLLPAKLGEYYRITPSEKTDFYLAGPTGPANVKDAVTPIGSINQSRVYLVREMLAPGTNDSKIYKPFRQLVRIEEIGEFYKMMERHRSSQQRFKKYSSADLDIKILDGSTDSWVQFTLRDAVEHSYLFDDESGGAPVDIGQPPYHPYNHHIPGDAGRRHLFNYQKPDGTFEKCSLFGQMEWVYFRTADVINLSTAAYQKLSAEFGGTDKVEEIFRLGMEYIHEVESRVNLLGAAGVIDPAEEVHEGGEGGEGREGRGGGRLQSKFQQSIGVAFNIDPAAAGVSTSSSAFKIPQATYAQSATLGIADTNGAMIGVYSWNALEASADAVVRRFVNLIKSFVDKLEYYFPDSFVLNKKFSSPWITNPSKYSTFYENVIIPNRLPLFVIGKDVGAATQRSTEVEQVVPLGNLEMAWAAGNERKYEAHNEYMRFMIRSLLTMIPVALRGDADVQTAIVDLPNDGDIEKEALPAIRRLIRALIQQQKDAFVELRHGDKPRTDRINETLASLTKVYRERSQPQKEIRGNVGYFRTELLVSPALAHVLAHLYNEADQTNLMPADPDFPDVPITIEKLRYILKMSGGDAFSQQDERRHAALIHSQMNVGATAPLMIETMSKSLLFGEQLEIEQIAAGVDGIGVDGGDDDFGGRRVGDQQQPAIGMAFRARDYEAAERFTSKRKHVNINIHKVGDRYYYGSDMDITSLIGAKRHSIPIQALEAHKSVDFWLNTPIFQHNVAALWAECSNPLLRMVGLTYFCTPISRKAVMAMVGHDIPVPIGFLFVRPHMAFEVMDAVKMQAGRETGMTLVQRGLAMSGDDATTQFNRLTYNNRSAAVVHRPMNVFILRSIMVSGYVGGMDCTFIDPRNYNATAIDVRAGSIIVLPIPYTEYVRSPFSLTGFWNVGEADENETEIEQNLSYTTAAWANALWGWNDARKAVNAEIYDPFTPRSNANAIIYQGQTLYMNSHTKQFDLIDYGKGHLGDRVYPGCMHVYKGELTEFDLSVVRRYTPV